MKLTDLEPHFYRYAGGNSFALVETVAEADSVTFLCPACFAKNEGPIGTHRIRVDFAGKGVPAKIAIHNSQDQPMWWNASGNDATDLTLTPSILILGNCGWHGFVTNGIVTC